MQAVRTEMNFRAADPGSMLFLSITWSHNLPTETACNNTTF